MKTLVTFGEMMLRLEPPGYQRLIQGNTMQATFAGSEGNVAIMAARLGGNSRFVTALPEQHPLSERCCMELRGIGVDTSSIHYAPGRLGLFYSECGSNVRPSKVYYDRANSVFSMVQPGVYDWENILNGADWFHWSGITPAVSASAAACCQEAILCAKSKGITVSCDINYRAKLWQYGKSASEVMPSLIQLTDIVIGNEEDCCKVFGIVPPEKNATVVDSTTCAGVCKQMVQRFPNIRGLAVSLRGSISANHNTWQAAYYDRDNLYLSTQYNITDIVDRVGAGDSFAGALIYQLMNQAAPKYALEYATAASCLKHTISGDYNMVSDAEVLLLMNGNNAGRVIR